MTAQEQLEAVQRELLSAYMTREDSEQKIKALRNVLAGIQLGRTLAAEAAPASVAEASEELPGG